ncbi:MAG: phage tail spike protein, partial [Staphylococcus simulans]|nr:phage tail spike protein [Staphylococcus simulans]
NMQKNYRVIIQDSIGQYREFIIEHISQDMDGYTEIETTASYLEDITGAPPYAPGSFDKKTTTEALYDVLKDTGWQVSEATEYGGIRTTSWTGFHTRYDILVQLCTTYDMIVDFYIELGSNTVDGRYVVLRKRNPIFQGKEIVKGKDLTGLKRIVDMSEVNTALLCVGPEKEDGSRITLTVKDDEAQAQFGLPGRYIWGIYEPETEDENMTEARLRSLGTTELNKRKKEKISYEVTSLDIKEYQPHEVVHIGDMVRIKDRDFTPPLYLEAEVIAEDYDMVTKESTYSFGEYKEYREDDLRQEFYKHLSNIRQRMNDNFSNVNTIVRETNSQLQYFEKKIIKSQDAPENPVNDMLWLDTSNPKVAVLRRYWNGQWINATAEKADDIDAVTREKALYDDLNNTFINLNIQHSKLLSEVYEVIDSEYLVDTALQQQVQQNLDNTINVYNAIKTNLESMTPETATIGKLVDTQALFLKYRDLLQTLYNSLENAKIAIDDRFKLLQSQYTDEKFNDAMSKVAEGIGGTWNAETGQLLADIPSQQELEDALKTYINGQDAALKQLIDGEVNSKITQTKNELSSNISAVSAKVDGSQVGGRNLVTDSHFYSGSINGWSSIYGNQKVENHILIKEVTTLTAANRIERQFSNLIAGETYTLTVYANVPIPLSWRNFMNANVLTSSNTPIVNQYHNNSVTFTATDSTIIVRGYVSDAPVGSLIKIDWFKLEKGNKATDWTPTPEDIQANIAKAQADATTASKAYADAQDALRKTEVQAYADGIVTEEEERAIADAQAKLEEAKAYAEETQKAAQTYTNEMLEPITSTQTKQSTDIKQLQDGITLKADKTEITTMYDNNIKPLETKVNDNTAQLKVQADQISSKVASSTYTADVNNIITRLNTADTQRTQLSNAINDRVTIKEYTDNKTATTNQINTAVNNVQVGGRNLVTDSHFYSGSINEWAPVYGTQKVENHTLIKEVTALSTSNRIERIFTNLTVGENYTLSVYTSVPVALEWRNFGNANVMNFNNSSTINKFYVTSVTFTPTDTTVTVRGYLPNAPIGTLIKIDWFKLEKGNKATDWTPAPEDVKADIDKAKAETDKTLSVMQTQINQNGTDINARATKEEFNASRKTLSKVVSDLTVNTTTGLTLSYDENGNIQSHTVGPDGIMFKGDRVNINVNKDFQVLAGNVNNKVGKDEIINRLNLSPEGLDINVNNLGIRGGDTTNYLSIKNQEILSRGTFTRTWGGVTDTPSAEIGIKDGYILSRNKKTGYNLYMTEKGLSTMMSGGVGSEQAGALEFHYDLFNDNSRGVRLSSTYGVVFLHSENSRIYTRSRYTTNI